MPSDAPPPRLRARGLTRADGGVVRVEEVDLQVAAGELLGLVGPNGGGKTTLLWLLSGLLTPDAGVAEVDGHPAARLRDQGAVGLITAQAGLYPLLTGRENLHFFGGLHGLSPIEVDTRVSGLDPDLRLEETLDRPVAVLSSGQQQKVSLARALLMAPVALLLDEPTANLDPVSARAVYAVVRAQADAGRAVVLATHDLVAVEALCDRAVVLDRTVRDAVRLDGLRRPPEAGPLLAPFAAALAARTPTDVPSPPTTRAAPGGRVGAIVRRELLEHRRQPGMLASMAGVLVAIVGLALGALGLLQVVQTRPGGAELLQSNLAFLGIALRDPLAAAASFAGRALTVLCVTQALGMTAVLAGHAVLHDRQVGALPFLALAPLRRWELVLGKVVGAALTPWLMLLAIGGAAGLVARALPVSAGAAATLPPSPGWLATMLLTTPAWCLWVSSVGAALSTRARDVRGSQQAVWAVVFLVVLGLGWAVGGAAEAPLVVHGVLTGIAVVLTAATVAIGAVLLERDLPR